MADANLLKELNIGTNKDAGRSRYRNYITLLSMEMLEL